MAAAGEAPPYATIRYELDGPVATITLARPEVLNAVGGGMKAELLDALDHADNDEAVRALIVTGEGRAFCSGADLSRGGDSFTETSADAALRPDGSIDYDHPSLVEGSGDFVERIFGFSKPVIGAINGPCAGLGASLPLTMDIRLASETASFNFVFARRGMLPECGSSWFLPRLVGIQTALEWCYTGRKVSADEALDARLVKAVYPADELMPAARAGAGDRDQRRARFGHADPADVLARPWARSSARRAQGRKLGRLSPLAQPGRARRRRLVLRKAPARFPDACPLRSA
jgi:enoyl-CoA hydratase/carnithine racemase